MSNSHTPGDFFVEGTPHITPDHMLDVRARQLGVARDSLRLPPTCVVTFFPQTARELALAAGLACVAIVGSLLLLMRDTPPASSDADFSTLTDAPSGDLNRVDIVFSEGVESGEILVIVEEFDGEIMSGPRACSKNTNRLCTLWPRLS